jgi:anaerobic magnesium-protoporphyrin IX monomethyl ester cyclase
MLNIVLIVPPGYSVPHAQFNLERLGLGYLAAPLRAVSHGVAILDCIIDRLDWAELLTRIRALRPQLLGVSLMSHHGVTRLHNFLCEARIALPSIHICLGGMFPSLNWKELLETLPEVDSVICGEGEGTIVSLASALQDGTPLDSIPGLAVRTTSGAHFEVARTPIDLDELLLPARDQLPAVLARGGPAALISSRGCYARCTFCTIEAVTRSLYPRPQRYRSPGSVVDEMEQLQREYGARRFYFVDENFLGPGRHGRERAQAIAREIKRRRLDVAFSLECRCMDVEAETFRELVEAGMQRVFLGVETIEQEELDRFRKAQDRQMVDRAIGILRDLGVHVEIGFILFTPWSTLESLARKRHFLEEFGSNTTASLGSYLSVMPGTELERQLRDEHLLAGEWPDYWFEFRDQRAAILFGLVQQELVTPWNEVIQELLSHQWNQPLDWGIEHARARSADTALDFVNELLQWTSSVRFEHFDALLEIVSRLSLSQDADNPPEWARDALREVSGASRRHAAEVSALLRALGDCRLGSSQSLSSTKVELQLIEEVAQ